MLACDPEMGKSTTAPHRTRTTPGSIWIKTWPRWLPDSDGGGFLWTTERTGRWQLERRGRDGAPGAVLVPANAGFRDLVGVAGGQVYYVASVDPTQARLGHVPLTGDSPDATATELTREGGMHRGRLGENEAVLIDISQDVGTMPRVVVRRLPDGAAAGELPSVALEPPFTPRTEILQLGPGEGFNCAVVRPRDFHPAAGTKYPVIVDVYGGPSHQQVTASMGTYLLDQWLADQGFIVVLADGRDTPGRGRDWERAIAGHFGSVPLDDQGGGVDLGRRGASRTRLGSRGHHGLEFRRLHVSVGGVAPTGCFQGGGGGSAGGRLDGLRHLLHRALPRRARRRALAGRIHGRVTADVCSRFEASAVAHSRHGGRQRLFASIACV